ncbi:probable serine/threonine-protein kinase DDB_G0282963 [Teleopsis dalmanni]|uniref:probable serine/threonine-protein kinase DDB_G0282963 n=1 Tax=Teleopsis dalmanni TaxID=139649 RepID=UPI0018CEDF56|nr:probable serine/threonine-protein kinase DDB_G0282963 [Teleopsis dalmanni]
MYKTIRHGENSLQYTILPQNDDFRIEGKLSSAGSSCSSSNNGTKKSKGKRPKRRSFFAYLGLIFVCTVIVGAVLIPFLVSTECLPSPTEWFLKTKAAIIKNVNGIGNGSRNYNTAKTNKINTNANADVDADADANNINMRNGISLGKPVEIVNKDGVERIILKVNKTRHNEQRLNSSASNNYTMPTLATLDQAMSNTVLTVINDNVKDTLTGSATVSSISNNGEAARAGSQNGIIATNDNVQYAEAYNSSAKSNGRNDAAQSFGSSIGSSQKTSVKQNYVTELRFDAVPADEREKAPSPTKIVITTIKDENTNTNNNQHNDEVNNKNEPLPVQNTFNIRIRPTLAISTSSINLPPRASINSNQNNQYNNSNSIPTITTRIIQVPLLKSAAKKPIIPPVLVKTNSQLILNNNKNLPTNNRNLPTDENNNLVDPPNSKHSQNSDWIGSHWPFVDPSTYIQWAGYKAEDSVLLPALLGFALIGVILIIAVCLVARNKRTIVSSVRKRNRNDIEETGAEDNKTLLTTANLSDED